MLLDRYLPRIEFDSYEDFKENYRVNVPEDFNFGWDIVDEWAKQEPEKKALVWLSHDKQEKTFTFTDISKLSNQTCHYFRSLGLKKRRCGTSYTAPPLGILGNSHSSP